VNKNLEQASSEQERQLDAQKSQIYDLTMELNTKKDRIQTLEVERNSKIEELDKLGMQFTGTWSISI